MEREIVTTAVDFLQGRVCFEREETSRYNLIWYVSNHALRGNKRTQPVNSIVEAYAIVNQFEKKAQDLALDFHFMITNTNERISF